MRIAILGGGPSGLYMLKRLIESSRTDIRITIIEKNNQLGAGMPYSKDGACKEHITNVSGNEIPVFVTGVQEWIATLPKETLQHYGIDPDKFNDYKVMPRLLFGQYLEAQGKLLLQQAKQEGIYTEVLYNSRVTDVADDPKQHIIKVEVNGSKHYTFDHVIICTGHIWPKKYEGLIPGYFDSPYPPAKLNIKANHPIGIKGASLTAIDAVRTLARFNGSFTHEASGKLKYQLSDEVPAFRLVLHSRNGLLPAVRFHLESSYLSEESVFSQEEISKNRSLNDGFLSLDYVFDKNFKALIHQKDPVFFEHIRYMRIEEFVEAMMELRERLDPFLLLKAEYDEAATSIRRRESVHWKELLAVLSYTMNYPAKYFSAEDMQRLQKILMPLISVVIAFVPQSSVEELLALHAAGILDLVNVGNDSTTEPCENGGAVYNYTDEEGVQQSYHYPVFVDCTGQPHLSYEDLPYKSLVADKTVSPARLQYRNTATGRTAMEQGKATVEHDERGNYYLRVPGIAINDCFQVTDTYGSANPRLYVMAVPFIGGYNPDYSGLDFCETASEKICTQLLSS
jgi:hypothetical protein